MCLRDDPESGTADRSLLGWVLWGSAFIGIPLASAGGITAVLALSWPALWISPDQVVAVGLSLTVIGIIPVSLVVMRNRLLTPGRTGRD